MNGGRILVALLVLHVMPALALAPVPPADLNDRAGLIQRIGARLPMELKFTDERGREVTLPDVTQGRPVLLALGYFRCPNLCDMVLHGLSAAAAAMRLQPGRDYELVFISIDPHETRADSTEVRKELAREQPSAQVDRWHLLTGGESSVRALAAAVGSRYFYDARNQQYAHAAGAIVLSGQLQVAQYFFGVDFPSPALRLALVGASRGQLGNLIDRLVLLCCGYDPNTGHYTVLIGKVMQVLGAAFLVLAAAALWSLQRRARA
jgi:protein SCO1/2